MLNIEKIAKDFISESYNQEIRIYFLKNIHGTLVGICNYGARITHFIVEKDNKPIDIVLGCDNLDDYLANDEKYVGVTVGRFANRIANGKFRLNNKEYNLAINNGTNSLHGGIDAFHNRAWDVLEVTNNEITLETVSPDMEEGFPGELTCKVSFKLTDDDELKINYWAKSTKETVINLTNHTYFNLNGEDTDDIVNHEVMINADYFVPVNESCIPLGHYQSVANTPFDFRSLKIIKESLTSEDLQIKIGNGYDHSFVINEKDTKELKHAASVKGDLTGIILHVYTTEPGMQFYTGNYLDQTDRGKNKKFYQKRAGFCLETQHHPDSPNQKEFPSTILKADDIFHSETVYKVS
jgi:aldose 1-epimerase